MRLIDSDDFKELLKQCKEYDIIPLIKMQPTIDAIPVVRCKDCINYEDGFCTRYGHVEAEHFCSYGEESDNNAKGFHKDKVDIIKFPVADNVQCGSIVITHHMWDVGIVSKVSNGKPIEILSRPYQMDGEKQYPIYGAIDTIVWYNTGIIMEIDKWEKLANEKKDAESFYKYWRKILNLPMM